MLRGRLLRVVVDKIIGRRKELVNVLKDVEPSQQAPTNKHRTFLGVARNPDGRAMRPLASSRTFLGGRSY
jgi:hypothetical protein